jgi:calnexin
VQASSIKAPFIDQFTSESLGESTWKASEAVKKMPDDYTPGEGDSPDELFRYRGEWDLNPAPGAGLLAGDKSLCMKTAAAHHAISAAFPKVVDPTDKEFVVQ